MIIFRNDDIVLKSLLKREVSDDLSSIGKDDFVYGVCRNACSYYNPYDLRMVKKAAIPADAIFYTITHDNVMMVTSFVVTQSRYSCDFTCLLTLPVYYVILLVFNFYIP